jgi:hypothetical protein
VDNFFKMKITLPAINNPRNFWYLVSLLSLLFGCQQDENEDRFILTAEKVSETQAFLEWTQRGAEAEYSVWRKDNTKSGNAEVIAITRELTFIDDNQPLSTSVSYYITTTFDNVERKSNIVEVVGRSYLPILPYQMELIPGTTLAAVRQYSSLVLLDY